LLLHLGQLLAGLVQVQPQQQEGDRVNDVFSALVAEEEEEGGSK
jgi:hypothetical protein